MPPFQWVCEALEDSLVVQGPGAGPEVAAGGVFAELLWLAMYLGSASP